MTFAIVFLHTNAHEDVSNAEEVCRRACEAKGWHVLRVHCAEAHNENSHFPNEVLASAGATPDVLVVSTLEDIGHTALSHVPTRSSNQASVPGPANFEFLAGVFQRLTVTGTQLYVVNEGLMLDPQEGVQLAAEYVSMLRTMDVERRAEQRQKGREANDERTAAGLRIGRPPKDGDIDDTL